MMKFTVNKLHLGATFVLLIGCLLLQHSASASPFGQGEFGADVPFGSHTSLSLSFDGDIAFTLTPVGNEFSGQGSHTVTVTSTDVVGYRLYLLAPSGTEMSNGTETIPASNNSTPASLSVNTWGYNTDGSSNYVGIKTTPTLLKDANGPHTNGDNTDVYYGVYVDGTKPASDYNAEVVYTVTAKYQ